MLIQTEKMAGLISQLLMLARADKSHKKLNLETVDLSELAAMVAEQQQENADARGIAIQTEIEPGLILKGDETMLMRMLINLMENGIKYEMCIRDRWCGDDPPGIPRTGRSQHARVTGNAHTGLSLSLIHICAIFCWASIRSAGSNTRNM